MANYLGIDLGTTETTVSVIEIEGFEPPLEKLRTLNIYQYDEKHVFDRDDKGLSSSIYIDRDNKKVYTGRYANTLYASGNKPLNTIRSVKTRIGGESMIQVPLDSETQNLSSYDMTELSSLLLKTVINSVSKQVTGAIDEVTITIPAGFNSDERAATMKAAKLAGFKHVHLLDEPTAVLLNYLNIKDDLDRMPDDYFYTRKNVLVYDIGGGTLDISIAKVEDNYGDFKVDILGRSKRMDFGGDDIDKRIAAYFLSEFEKINSSIETRTIEEQAVIVSRIVSQAEKAKVSFNQKIAKVADNVRRRERAKEPVNFEIIDNLKITDLLITDNILKDILSPIISSSGTLVQPIKKSLRDSELTKEDIDLVILTGGTGKFYLVEETLSKFFGDNVEIIDFTESNAVSKGAAIHSYNQDEDELKKIDISDIMSDSIFIKNGANFDKLISHDQELDSSGVYSYKFLEGSDRLDVFLYYGESAKDPAKLTEITGVFETLKDYYREGDIVELGWTFDSNKILKISHDGKELITTNDMTDNGNELINNFQLN
ncbi:Hsp70 family protein [Colwellia hornerae]|uniref:Hsp70 family protein n=1 Tax=Colwellia hornerae TaxID=89402 RepID=A0A5C6QRC0_9GAMM|nr:Hsp70 family protein [Colwellia hornerae]TWX55785.1 Hsp70 family protein [Colwellia hornerae]TWX61995.1 Hsp70 family protein [Colwellia hornerae]TWX71327.1 Hsp70 family protein [Colwellia hornerae]